MRRLLLILIAATAGLVAVVSWSWPARSANVRPRQVSVEFHDDAIEATVRFAGSPSESALRRLELAGVLTVSVLDEQGRPGPPMFGTHDVLPPDAVRFRSTVAATPGREYLAVARHGDRRLSLRRKADPLPPTEPATIERIDPTADELPANLLKFYLHFDRPMRQTVQIFDRMHILDDTGQAVYDPWRRFPQWSDDGRRFTLWVHPGRVKQGVNLREDFGPVLEPGRSYTLVIEQDVLDEQGRPLARQFEKRFTALPELRERIRLDRWTLLPPKAGTRQPLSVNFNRPLDHALARRLIRVIDDQDQVVPGEAVVGDLEREWSFVPAQPWQSIGYSLVADELLEDQAGNTPLRIFDTDLKDPDTSPIVSSVPFRPRPRR